MKTYQVIERGDWHMILDKVYDLLDALDAVRPKYQPNADVWLALGTMRREVARIFDIPYGLVDISQPATKPSDDKPSLGYDPHEHEGDPESGWKKCVVCQAFTIDPETGRCVHWGKDVGRHEDWYGSTEQTGGEPS